MKIRKAVSLVSGGLDSILALKVIESQGIKCIGLFFSSPFWSNAEKEENLIRQMALDNDIEIKVIKLGADYLKMVRDPKHGHGKEMNPCIDCKIFMLKKAKKIMKELGADFIATGEVLGQRPMSQHRNALNLIAKDAGVKDILVRPLSAKLLTETDVEKRGLLSRENLADINGRTRKGQYELAEKLNIKLFSSPAGGCLLTDKLFCRKLKDLFDNKSNPDMSDVEMLKYGRHFKYKGIKIIVGRNEKENGKLLKFKNKSDLFFEVPDIAGPVTIFQGKGDNETVKFAAELTAYYSDSPENEVKVIYGKKVLKKSIVVKKPSDEEVAKCNLVNINYKKK